MRNSKTLRSTVALLIGAILVVILALENRHGVSVRLFWWNLPHVSLALLMAICVFLGAGLALGAVLWDGRRNHAEQSAAPLEKNQASFLPPQNDEDVTQNTPEELPAPPVDYPH